MGNAIPLTVKPGSQSLENGLSCIFQASGNILLQNVQNQHDYTHATGHKAKVKGTDPTWSWICSSLLPSFQEKKPKGTSCSPWTQVTHSALWFLSSPHRSLSNIQAARRSLEGLALARPSRRWALAAPRSPAPLSRLPPSLPGLEKPGSLLRLHL